MRILQRKFFAAKLATSLLLSLCSFVPAVFLAAPASAEQLDTLQFSRNKVTSTFKNNGGTAYAACYENVATCTMQRSTNFEWTLPSGGYFRLERSVNPEWPWRVLSCSAGGSCSTASTIGRIFAYKDGSYFVYRAPNASYNWVFSLGAADPYLVSVGGNISWSFDGPGTGREGAYNSRPSSVTSAITGEATVGSELTAAANYVGVDGQVSYQWKRSAEINEVSFTDISGAINSTYTTTNADADKYLRLTVTVTNFFGSRSATSTHLLITAPPTQLDSTFDEPVSTLGGFTVNVTNFDASFTYSASVTEGVVRIGNATGNSLPIAVSGLSSNQGSTVSVVTRKTGMEDGVGSVAGSSLTSAITSTTGPVGRWIASSISKNGSSYLVANQGGFLYRSTDDGLNWKQIGSIQNWSSITQSSDGQIIFATDAGGMIFRSTDSGTSWGAMASTQNWRSIACNLDCSIIIAAAFGGKVWRSADSGVTWTEIQSARNWRQVAISEFGNTMAAVVYGGKVYVSTDFGNTWAESATTDNWIDTKLTENGSVVYALTASGKIFSSNTNALNLTQYVITGPGAALALDWGATGGNSGLIACGSNGGIYAHQGEGLEVGLVAANPTPWSSCATSSNNGKIIATSTTGLIYISTNSGTNWTARSISSGNINRRALVASENGRQIYSAIYGGEIEYSTDSGATWSTALNNDENWIAIAASANFQKIYAVAYQGYIYQSQDSGATWQKVNFPKLPWISIAVSANGAKAVAATKGGNIYNTSDSGESWTPRDQKRKWVSVASSSNGDKFAAVVEGGFVYTSSNGGDNWTQRGSERNWSAIASSSNGNKLVATVARGKIYTSTDSGVTWTARASERNWLNVVSSTSGNKLIAVVGTGKIYTSANSGGTWTARENNRNWRALYLTGNGNRAYAADFGRKLYRSTDSGKNWTAL
jgi:photosystem II stability/assembly factor-like uncharacterized protein